MFNQKQKNILFIIPSLSGGGAERVLVHILKRLNREKFRLHLVLFEHKGEYLNELPQDVIVYDLKKRNRFDFLKLIFLLAYKIYPAIRPDLVVSFLEYANIVALSARMLSRVKPAMIVSERSYLSISLKQKRTKGLRIFLARKLYSKADRVLTVSHQAAKDLAQSYCLDIDKIKTIYNGVDLDFIDQLADKEHTRTSERSALTIMACGRLTAPKNYPLLLKAFAQIQKETEAVLLILGQGEQEAYLRQFSQQLNIDDKVTFLGFQENPYAYMARSDLFVLSSSWEGFPNVVLEAMACKVPVIATRCPSGPDEIITDGVNGLLVEVNDVDALAQTMLKVLKDQSLRTRLVKAGRKRVEDFRVEKMIAEYQEVFESVCKQ